ncbi:MAG: hypothetical protein HKP27_09720 [Myxococcales bacterium]|nr:hypothetical protein [Myxococcales bacterium]
MSARLPEGFGDLEVWVSEWSLATQDERWDKRLRSSAEELQAFYHALLPYLPAILDYVDAYPLGELPETAERLFNLAMTLAEVAPNVELYGGAPDVPHSFEERRFIAAHGQRRGTV